MSKFKQYCQIRLRILLTKKLSLSTFGPRLFGDHVHYFGSLALFYGQLFKRTDWLIDLHENRVHISSQLVEISSK